MQRLDGKIGSPGKLFLMFIAMISMMIASASLQQYLRRAAVKDAIKELEQEKIGKLESVEIQ